MSTGFVLNIPQEMINRLDLADQKIQKLAKTSEDAQARIVSAFKSMGTNGVDAFIQRLDVAQQKLAQLGGTQINMGINANTSGFQQLIDAINNLSQASKTNITINGLGTVGNQTQTAIDAINKLMATLQQLQQMGGQQFLGGVNSLGRQTLREMNKEARKMQKTMQDLDDAIQKYGISATDLANKLQQARQAQQQFNDAAKQQAQADVSGLIGMKGQQTTLNELKNYANELKRTMANLDPKSQEWKELNDIYKQTNREIKNIQNSMKDVQKQSRSLMDISGQLARRLALVFSVSQITGYVKKLIEVRGEFELQQRSLQAILQNKDEANRIWQQTVDLAVRSPFRVKELVSYTKQLAAYRIESDKLFETNKMLADISAGLGVDMQRLILAFGQVRSAAYLRGTELRQFTEAGIPILEQLAQYFTELEGRAVSVGDVFERVSKRMVSFADVEEIFKRMTAEGGTFYRMQEIQAETLKGMWSNLKDSVDIMVNEIGKGNESTLKNSLALVKQLVDNWRKVKPVIETVGISLMTYFGVDVLRKISRALGSMLTTLSAHPVLAIASAFALLATYIWRAAKAQTEFNAAMSEVENENIKSLEDNIRLYHELRDAINDVTKSSEDREKAYNRLKSVFDDILPDEYLAKEYVEDLSKGYRDAEKAMTDYYDAKTQAQKKDRIEGLYAKELDTDISELITSVRSRIETRRDIPEALKTVLQSGVSGVVNGIIEEVKSGDLANDIDTIANEIQKRLEKYSGVGLPWTHAGQGIFQVHDVKDIVKTLDEYKDALEDIQGLPYETYGQKVAGEWLNKEKESLQQISDIYKKLLSLYSKYSKATDEDKVDIADDISLAMSQVPEKLNAYLPLLQESVDKMKAIAEKGAFEFTASMQTLESDFVEGLVTMVKNSRIENTFTDPLIDHTMFFELADNLQESIKKASDKLDMTPFQNAVVGGARQIAARFGQDVNIFEKFIPNQKESLSNIRQEVKSQIESYESQILEMQTSLTQGMYVLSEEVLNNTQETIKSMTDQLPALKAFLAFLGKMEKDKGRKDKTIEERIKVVDQMNAKYKELNKTLSKTESLEGAFEAYKDAFATAYSREDVRQMSAEDFAKNVLNFPDEDAVIAWLDNLAKTVKDKEDKFKVQMAKGKFEMDVKVRLKQEDDQKLLDDIQELFDQYDLSLELKKLNIPSDLAKSLFDVDYIDLDGLKKAVQEQESKFIGTDMEEEYKKFLDKIDDMENKAAKERMKTYSKYLLEGMSERVKLKIEEMRKLKEIEESDKFTPEKKERIKEGVSKEARAEQQKQEWKDFQGTEMYTMMFEDLEHYGTAAIEMLYTKLSELKTSLSDLPASEVKEIVGQIEKLENIKIERNPFESWKTYAEEVKKIGFSEEELQTMLLGEQDKESQAQGIIDIINLIQTEGANGQATLEIINSLTKEQLVSYGDILNIQQETGDSLEDIKNTQQGIVDDSKKQQGIISGQQKAYKKLSKSQKDSLELTQEWLTQVGNLFSASKGLMESLGVESDSVAMTIADTGSSMISLTLSAVQFTLQLQAMGVAANSALGIIGYIAIAIQAVATVLSAIFSAKDKALQAEIDGLIAKAEELHKKYEELSDAIDSAYDASVVRQFNKEIEKTIQLEIKAIEAAIAAEKSQKSRKVDWNWVAEQEEAIKQLYDTLNDEHDSYIERWGGFGSESNRFDFIESMTQAWLDSFKETGDGLAGLEETWDEYFDNLAMKQMALRVSKKAVDEYLDLWDKYVSAESVGGEGLTEKEAQELRLRKEALLKELSERYTSLAESLGVTPTAEGGGLSALQKGIKGITEDQADVLASYWNSVRGYTASIDSKMDLVLANLGAGAEDNPMLEQIRMQTGYLRDIKDTLTWATTSEARALYVRLTKDSLPS